MQFREGALQPPYVVYTYIDPYSNVMAVENATVWSTTMNRRECVERSLM